MFIYKIENLVNGKVYVGQTTQKPKNRWTNHKGSLKKGRHSNYHLQASWNKYGSEMFTFEIIEEFKPEMNFDLDNLERYWIKHFDSTNHNKGYNLDSGGHAQKTLSEDTRKKISNALKGKSYLKSNLGKALSIETKRKISESLKNRPGVNLGKTFSASTRQKMSESAKGRIFSVEHRNKIGAANRQRKLSKETKEKIGNKQRAYQRLKRQAA